MNRRPSVSKGQVRPSERNSANPRTTGSAEPGTSRRIPKKRSGAGLQFDKAIPGFLQFKTAEGLSRHTLMRYEHDLNWQHNSWGTSPSAKSRPPTCATT
jgi:hypothetical protein